MAVKKEIKYQIAFPEYIPESAVHLMPKKELWGIDKRCGTHATRIAAIRSQLPDYAGFSDEQVKYHYQCIYRNLRHWKVVKADSLPDLAVVRQSFKE
jgi:hypothetical protein